MKKIFLIAFLLCENVFANSLCDDLLKKVDNEQVYIEHSRNLFRVISKERLYFNSSPSKQCKIKDVFLVYGDNVTGYSKYDGFLFSVFYKKNGETVSGWLKLSELESIDLTSGPTSEEQMVYNMIPDIISKNKLTKLSNECIKIVGDSGADDYYNFHFTKRKNKTCKESERVSFSILIKKVSLEVYTNQGSVNNEYREIKSD